MNHPAPITVTREAELPRSIGVGSIVWLESTNPTLPGFNPTDMEAVREMPLQSRVDRAIALLKASEPEDGYYLAYSGGKDSDAIKKLCQLAGVSFEAWYNQTTIDPPEVVRYIKTQPDVKWNIPEHGNMMMRVSEKNAAPPTRMMRWCCEEYKEHGGHGRTKVMGVRAAESPKRAKRWSEIAQDQYRNVVICPIVLWSDDQLWEFLRAYEVKYCSLYDEGWTRLGCVGCPLNNKSRLLEFKRWPAFEINWKKAIIANWTKYHAAKRDNGKPYFHTRFATGEDMWKWWMQEKRGDVLRDDCQSMLLWTNEPPSDDAVLSNEQKLSHGLETNRGAKNL